MRKIGYVTFLLLCIIINSCKEKPNEVRTFSSDMESSGFSSYWTGLESIIEGSAHSGTHFSRIGTQHVIGFGYQSELPGFIKTKNFLLELEFYYRMHSSESKALLTITIKLRDSLIYNESFKVWADSAVKRWALFKTKSKFPGSLPPNATLSVSLQNIGQSFMDIDDYKLSFNRIGRPSFLVVDKKKTEESILSGFSFRPVYKNKYYTITYSDKLGDLQVRSAQNEKIFSSVRYYVQWMKGKDTLSGFADKLLFTHAEKDELRITGETHISYFTLKLFVSDDSPLIRAETKTVFKDSVRLLRESICVDYTPDESEIYRKSTLVDIARIRNEYWLDKEGFKIGSNTRTVYFYHNPDISSVQVSSKINEFTINLDYYMDHPFACFIPRNKAVQDMSCNRYKAGAYRENAFQFYVGLDAGSLPRFMKSPNGYVSSYILNSEWDSTDIHGEFIKGDVYTATPVKNSYFTYFMKDSSYNFNGHLMFPYPGFGDFFPTPLFWNNATTAPDVYSWRYNPFLSRNKSLNSLFTVQHLKDFVDNRGIIFTNHSYNTGGTKDSIPEIIEFKKVREKLLNYGNQRLVNFSSVKDIFEYWHSLEKVKLQILTDGKFKLYNSSYQIIKGLSLAIKADSVWIDNKKPENCYRDSHGDLIVWFDLPALGTAIIAVKAKEE